jgi:hypothetical protein
VATVLEHSSGSFLLVESLIKTATILPRHSLDTQINRIVARANFYCCHSPTRV